MMWKSKDWYCTLFCPKYCATSGVAPNSASAATIPPMRRMTVILSTRSRVRPPRAPGRRPTGARADRTPAIRDEKRAPRNRRSRAAPTAPVPGLPRDAARCRAARARSSSAPPSPARAHPMFPTRSRRNLRRPSSHAGRAPSGRSPCGRREPPSRAAAPSAHRRRGARRGPPGGAPLAGAEPRRQEPQRRQRIAAGAPRRAPAAPASHSALSGCLFRPPVRAPRPHSSSMLILDRTLSVALFLDHGHLDFRTHVGVQLDPDAELAQLADRLGEIDLALVHLDPELLELALHVARRDRA